MSKFGDLLRFYRRQTTTPVRGGFLTQTRFGELLAQELVLLSRISGTTISNWERGKHKIDNNDTHLLFSLIKILHLFGGIETLEKANTFLEAGNYRRLTDDEATQINPDWVPEALAEELSASYPESGSIPQPGPYPPTVPLLTESPPNMAPPPPQLIIGREETHQEIKRRLGISPPDETSTPHKPFTAMQGWPGVGKTTTSAVLAHDPEMLEKYPDGVLWLALAKEPNVLSDMAAWGRALGTEELLRTRDLEDATRQLTALLRNKRMLLIVDDVWEAEHAIPFNVGGQHCAMIITTRSNKVAQDLAPTPGDVYKLEVLPEEKAIQLLKELAPTVVAQHPNESLKLVQELEGLPLAIQVAGHLLNVEASYGFGVIDLIAELQEGAKLLKAKAPSDRIDLENEIIPTVAVLLKKSTDRLDPEIRDQFAFLGPFAPKPATFDLAALKAVWQIEDPKPTARILVDRGLLEPVPEMGHFQMHALLVMLARSLLTDD